MTARHHRRLLVFFAALFLVGVLAHAETNPFAGYIVDEAARENVIDNNGLGPRGTGNGLATGIFNNRRADESTVVQNPEMVQRGREYKAQDAANQGNVGAGVATGVGIALISTGIPMTMSIDIPTIVAGYQLITMGSMELAQGIANTAASNANQAQNQLLLRDDGTSSGTQLPNANQQVQQAVQSNLNTPEFSQALSSRGINPEQFFENLSNGQVPNVKDLLGAAGLGNISAEDLEKGMKLAEGEAQSAKAEAPTSGYDESVAKPGAALASGGATGGGSGAETSASAAASAKNETGSSASASGHSAAGRGIASVNGAEGAAAPGGPVADASLFEKIFGKPAPGSEAAANQALSQLGRTDLESLGLQKPAKGQNIFKMARRTYKSFHKWRKGKRVATSY